ncbi:MAG TPA: hypothetical protein VJO35_15790 [Terriglobales bacterium]|nr:hypothetical protein [Terriglobales bacterium]
MKKFWRGYRQAKDIREREERARLKSELLEKLRELVATGGHEAEAEYVHVLKELKPEITKEELSERIRQYHAAVSERQSRDRGLI